MTRAHNPTIAEAMEAFVQSRLRRVRTITLGRVERWDATKQAADIKPLIRDLVEQVEDDAEARELDVIPLVPVATLALGGFTIQATPAVGDVMIVLVADREIEQWLKGSGGVETPRSTRKHDLSDAIAIPWSPATWSATVGDIGSGEMVIGRADGAGELRIKQDGTILGGARGASTKGVARLDDSTVVDSTTDGNFVAWIAAVHTALLSTATGVGVGPGVAAYGTAFAQPPSSATGKITSASSAMEVE